MSQPSNTFRGEVSIRTIQPIFYHPDYYEFGRTEFVFNVKKIKYLSTDGMNSPAYSTGDVDWHLNVKWTGTKSEKALSAYLCCDAVDVASWWTVDADFRIVLVNKKNEKASVARQMCFTFVCENDENHGWKSFTLYDDLLDEDNGFVDEDGTATFRVLVGINSVTGFYTPKYFNFLVPQKDFSDCTIVVGDRTFHVNKIILSVHSPVFSVSFNQQSNLEYDDLDPAEFNNFLQLLYAVPIRICKTNVSSILKHSIRFETNGLKQSCEQYLEYALKSGDMKGSDAVKVAYEHKVETVLKKAVDSVTNMKEMKEKFGDFEDLPEEILKQMVNKSLNFN